MISFESLKQRWISYWYIKPLAERRQEFENDVNSFLKKKGLPPDKLLQEEIEFLMNMGSAIYSVRHNGFGESYLSSYFDEDFGKYANYKMPEDPIGFFEKSNLPELSILEVTTDETERAIVLSEEFKQMLELEYWTNTNKDKLCEA